MENSNDVISVEHNKYQTRPPQPLRNGLVIEYDEDGSTIVSETHYMNDIPHGIRNYYRNGYLSYTCNYLNGEMHGTSIQYHAPGKIWNIQNYEYGIHHGQYIVFYENGMVESVDIYEDGKKHGWCAKFDILGKTIVSNQYENGELISLLEWKKEEDAFRDKYHELKDSLHDAGE